MQWAKEFMIAISENKNCNGNCHESWYVSYYKKNNSVFKNQYSITKPNIGINKCIDIFLTPLLLLRCRISKCFSVLFWTKQKQNTFQSKKLWFPFAVSLIWRCGSVPFRLSSATMHFLDHSNGFERLFKLKLSRNSWTNEIALNSSVSLKT